MDLNYLASMILTRYFTSTVSIPSSADIVNGPGGRN